MFIDEKLRRYSYYINFCLMMPLLACVVYAQVQAPQKSFLSELKYGFKGIAWGSSYDNFHRISRMGSVTDNFEKFIGYDASINYLFRDNGKFYGAEIYMDGKYFIQMVSEFSIFFGQPDKGTSYMKIWSIEKLRTENLYICIGKIKEQNREKLKIVIYGLVDGFFGEEEFDPDFLD